MVAANAEAIDVTPYVGLDANYALVDTDSSHSISSKDWSLSGVIGGRTDRFGLKLLQCRPERTQIQPRFPHQRLRY